MTSHLAVAALALMLAFPAVAGASIEDTVGLGPRATALGGSCSARAGDHASTWYNPAGLAVGVERGLLELSVGAVLSKPLVSARWLAGGDVPLSTPPSDTVGLLVGVHYDASDALSLPGLALGASIYMPNDLFAWNIHPDDSVQWAFLTDRTQHVGVLAGVAWQVAPWLSAGVAARAMFDTETLTLGRVTGVEQTDKLEVSTQLGEDVTVFGKVAPIAGVLLTPAEGLSVALVYRATLFVDDWGHTRINGVPGFGDLGYAHRFAHYYTPEQATVAVAWGPSEALTVSVDVTAARWSEARTSNSAQLGPGRYGDTVRGSAGVEWLVRSWLEVLAGYELVPSPIDNFGGPTNLLDNDRHVGSVGVALDLGELRLLAALQLALLVEREEVKDWRRFETDSDLEDNPGTPGYRYGGFVPGGSVELRSRW